MKNEIKLKTVKQYKKFLERLIKKGYGDYRVKFFDKDGMFRHKGTAIGGLIKEVIVDLE